jgi:hypothetical protein
VTALAFVCVLALISGALAGNSEKITVRLWPQLNCLTPMNRSPSSVLRNPSTALSNVKAVQLQGAT